MSMTMRTHWDVKIPIWKRALDVSWVVLALPLLVPVSAIISAVIWAVSPGPILLLNERVGFRGRKFLCFKFRTLRVGSYLSGGLPPTKMHLNDPRIIPCGRFLRSTGLDELPQLLNVLAGQMSIVGPRSSTPYEYDCYTPAQKRRFDTLPGLTGLWQVSGKDKTTFIQMIRHDIEYVDKKSLWTDLAIIFRTVPAVLKHAIESKQRNRPSQSRAHVDPKGSSGISIRNASVFYRLPQISLLMERLVFGKLKRECFQPAFGDLLAEYTRSLRASLREDRWKPALVFTIKTLLLVPACYRVFISCLFGRLLAELVPPVFRNWWRKE